MYTLVTGAAGEIGHSLVLKLSQSGTNVIALDTQREPAELKLPHVTYQQGDILDATFLTRLRKNYTFDTVFHLAALLSTSGERDPQRAHNVNVNGTVNLLEFARAESERLGYPAKFILPSTIAVYGLPSSEVKATAGPVNEDQFLQPITMYGINKLYAEHLGRYYERHFRSLGGNDGKPRIDFRAVRFPGIMSATTLPSGGTSDYGPEMIHAAAKGLDYECFVSADATLPFMVMPDAVQVLLRIAAASKETLTREVYNVSSFSIKASEIATLLKKFFPKFRVTYRPHPGRFAIVESWPALLDDSAARRDWGWQPGFDVDAAFADYLVPTISARYHEESANVRKHG